MEAVVLGNIAGRGIIGEYASVIFVHDDTSFGMLAAAAATSAYAADFSGYFHLSSKTDLLWKKKFTPHMVAVFFSEDISDFLDACEDSIDADFFLLSESLDDVKKLIGKHDLYFSDKKVFVMIPRIYKGYVEIVEVMDLRNFIYEVVEMYPLPAVLEVS